MGRIGHRKGEEMALLLLGLGLETYEAVLGKTGGE